jgi:hypothetical protein
MEDVGTFYGHLVHFTHFCYILWTFGRVRGNLVYFSPFWYFVPRKIWQPLTQRKSAEKLTKYSKIPGSILSYKYWVTDICEYTYVFVTYSFYIFVTFSQKSSVGQVFLQSF